jgi:hypothetical protein
MSLKDTSIRSTAKRVLKEIMIAFNEFGQEYPNMPIVTVLQSPIFLKKLAVRGLGGKKIYTAAEIVQEIPSTIEKTPFNLTCNIVWNIVRYELSYDPTIGTNEDVTTTLNVVKEYFENLNENQWKEEASDRVETTKMVPGLAIPNPKKDILGWIFVIVGGLFAVYITFQMGFTRMGGIYSILHLMIFSVGGWLGWLVYQYFIDLFVKNSDKMPTGEKEHTCKNTNEEKSSYNKPISSKNKALGVAFVITLFFIIISLISTTKENPNTSGQYQHNPPTSQTSKFSIPATPAPAPAAVDLNQSKNGNNISIVDAPMLAPPHRERKGNHRQAQDQKQRNDEVKIPKADVTVTKSMEKQSQTSMDKAKPSVDAGQRYRGIKGIVLVNGNKIEGQIISMDPDKIKIRTKEGKILSYDFKKEVENFIHE